MQAYAQARSAYQNDGMQTTPQPKLLSMLYERLLRDLTDARTAIENRRIEAAHDALVHAQEIVLELHLALDIDGFDGAHGLADVYVYLNERLVEANRMKSPIVIDECRAVVTPIAEAFAGAVAAGQPEKATVGDSV